MRKRRNLKIGNTFYLIKIKAAEAIQKGQCEQHLFTINFLTFGCLEFCRVWCNNNNSKVEKLIINTIYILLIIIGKTLYRMYIFLNNKKHEKIK